MSMPDSIFEWVGLVLLGLVVLAFLLVAVFVAITFVAALFEKQYVEVYTPLLPSDHVEGNPYFTVMNQLAAIAGYTPCGECQANRQGKFSQVRAALWLSPDASTVAIVAGGKIAKVRFRKTMLISRLREGKTLVTQDEHAVLDLSETREVRLVLNADFAELAQVHTARVRLRSDTLVPFARENVAGQLNQLEAERVERLINDGWGRYRDPQCSCWRHNFRGACRVTFTGFYSGLQQAQDQSERQDLARPGG